MVYPRRLLNDDETVAVFLHPHWWYFARPVALLSVAVVVASVVLTKTDAATTARTAGSWASLCLLVLSVAWLVARTIEWLTTSFVITTTRVVSRSGLVVRRCVEIPLDRIDTVSSRQNIFERFVVVGDLTIESGEFTRERFVDIRNPERVKQVLHGLVAERRDRERGLASTDVAGQLERFEGMLERGTLTPDEFEVQKQRLLDQL